MGPAGESLIKPVRHLWVISQIITTGGVHTQKVFVLEDRSKAAGQKTEFLFIPRPTTGLWRLSSPNTTLPPQNKAGNARLTFCKTNSGRIAEDYPQIV
jgi:hypothetical protein